MNGGREATRIESAQVYRRHGACCSYYPDVRVVCRYPLDPEDAPARWIVESVASVEHLIVVPEATLLALYDLQEEQA
jgi:hypothetical protein